MDQYPGRIASGRTSLRRNGLKDTVETRDGDTQFCTRIGCSGRLNQSRSSQIRCLERAKYSRTSNHSSNGKVIIGSSSKTCSVRTSTRKSGEESHGRSMSQLETDSSETNSIQIDSEVMVAPTRNQTRSRSESSEANSSKVAVMEVGCPSGKSHAGPRKTFHHKYRPGNQNTPLTSSVSTSSKNNGPEASRTGNGNGYGLRNLKCNELSDVLPQKSQTETSSSRRDAIRRRNVEVGSSSSSQGKKMTTPTYRDRHAFVSSRGISISDPRQSRNRYANRDNGVVSVRTQRQTNVNYRMRLSDLDMRDTSQTETSDLIAQLPCPQMPTSATMSDLSQQFLVETSSTDSSTCSLPGNDGDDLHNIRPTTAEVGLVRLLNRDAFRPYNMDGIAEVLLALERIEQDEELTYEQLLTLETNLFLSGLNFPDQHRDLRLDIDNMSYEELLALEERMGTVSTALSEEDLAKCLKRSIYQVTPVVVTECNGDLDDCKCSICQEEYAIGDDVGKLGCEHGYHVSCINQWLRLKNWCPICKCSAAPSALPSKSV